MKSNTKTVLAVSLTGSTSYSSGPLDVGDLRFLLVSASASSGSGTLAVSHVDANGHVYQIATLGLSVNQPSTVAIGEGSTYAHSAGSSTNFGIPYFGDQIQIDQVSGTIDVDISVKGK